jgi:uncharacterized protein
VVAVFPSLEGENLEDFSIRLAEKWRVGRKELDNGAIVAVFLRDRKMRIEVGYGLEGAIPDIEAARIIRETMAPRFREARYAAGLEEAARALYARVDRTPAAARSRPARGRDSVTPSWPVLGFLVLIAIIAMVLAREAVTTRGFTGRRGYTASGRGWGMPPVIFFPPGGGRGGGGWGGGGGGGFSAGGGSFGGGGASGDW